VLLVIVSQFHKHNRESVTILFPPRMKMVTALEFWQPSMTNILSFVVPNVSSRTMPARPSLSAVNSLNRGTIRPPVAIAINYNIHHSQHSHHTLQQTVKNSIINHIINSLL